MILEKTKETGLNLFQGSVTVIQIMKNYQEARVKLTNIQLNKLKSAANNKIETILKTNRKTEEVEFPHEDEELPHELFVTTRQKTKIRNAIAKNMSTDIKLSKAQLSKMIQSGGFLRNVLSNLDKKKVITDLAIPLTRVNLPGLVSKLSFKRNK